MRHGARTDSPAAASSRIWQSASVTLIAAKFILSPLCVVLVSMAGRRWGIKVAGMLGSLPVVAAPILLAITLANGTEFGADAATGTLLGLCALTTFVVIYTLAAQRMGPLPCLLLGWAGYLGVVALLNPLPQAPLASLALAGLSFWVGLKILPVPSGPALAPVSPPWWDLPLRALAALALVVSIATASSSLGPQLSGLLTPFPIITCVLAIFTHAQGGPKHVIVLMRSFLVGFYAFASFFFVAAICLNGLGVLLSFLLATAVSLAVQTVAFKLAGR